MRSRLAIGSRLAQIALFLVLPIPAFASGDAPTVPGFVDGTKLAELAGDDAVTVEVTLGKTILRPLLRADPDLEALGGGLDSIYALVLQIESRSVVQRVVAELRDIERRLMASGWERLARVRDKDEEVKVLVLTEDEKTFGGLVVLVVEPEDGATQVVFANIAGQLDLAAIERLGDRFDVPGLEDLDLEGDDRRDGGAR